MTEQFSNFSQSSLAAAITASQIKISVASASTFPSIGNFRIVVQSFDVTTQIPTSAPELMLVTAVNGTQFTVTRGIEGTQAIAFASGAQVTHIVTAGVMQTLSGGISPLTTKGDIYGYSTTNDRIAVGTNGTVLIADSTQSLGVKWNTLSNANLANIFHFTDTTDSTVYTNGSMILDGGLGVAKQIRTNTSIAANTSITAGTNMTCGATSFMAWFGSSRIQSQSDGILTLFNVAANDFTRLQWGGTGTSNPAIGHTGTTLNFVLADGSAACPISAASLTAPLLIGGSGTTQTLTYKTTTGTGATGADHIFVVGTNGGTEAMRIKNNGNIGINNGAQTIDAFLTVGGDSAYTYPAIGTTRGAINIIPLSGTNGNSVALTFATNSGGTVNTLASAGIYVATSGAFGARMYLGTAASFATGVVQAMQITESQNVIMSNNLQVLAKLVVGSGLPNAILTVDGDSTFSYPTPGTTRGAINIVPTVGTNDNSCAITFGAGGGGTPNDVATAGIYVQTSNSYGSRMYLCTTNSFGTGAKQALQIDSLQNILLTNKITNYNSIATVAGGIPSEVATIDSTGLTANVAASTLYAVPASGIGMYRVSCYVVETIAGSISSTLPNVQIVFTDNDSNTSITIDSTPILGIAGIGQTGALTANTVGTASSGVIVIYVKASTTIQYQTVNYASTVAGMTYALRIKLEAL